MLMVEPVLNVWLDRARAEYREMPGLALTRSQMCRLWMIDEEQCDLVVEALVETGFLKEGKDHRYVRRH